MASPGYLHYPLGIVMPLRCFPSPVSGAVVRLLLGNTKRTLFMTRPPVGLVGQCPADNAPPRPAHASSLRARVPKPFGKRQRKSTGNSRGIHGYQGKSAQAGGRRWLAHAGGEQGFTQRWPPAAVSGRRGLVEIL
ncbi:hypothetical protein AAFF_G00153150 [Aldrovandia affinis]|uniref:Uncharacterized protein n=1 Tax=Aldrovandia affinis TaxID=143900 RepID=A0AAD7SZJ7_9TELE|nr:hypothetical protein AAFF_G00153150 [Aldrovandia affinis]